MTHAPDIHKLLRSPILLNFQSNPKKPLVARTPGLELNNSGRRLRAKVVLQMIKRRTTRNDEKSNSALILDPIFRIL